MNIKSFTPSNHKLAQAIAVGLFGLAASQAQAVNYTFNDLGTINGPYTDQGLGVGNGDFNLRGVVAMGINNQGQVTGNNGVNAVVWNGNTQTVLGTLPGWQSSFVYGPNNAGQVVGEAFIGGDQFVPVRWDGTTPTVLDTLNGWFNQGITINNSGVIVGNSAFGTGSDIAPVKWIGTAITHLPTFTNSIDAALSINDAGVSVGWSNLADGSAGHAVMWDTNNNLIDIGVPLNAALGGSNSGAWGINNAGQVAGYYLLDDGATSHAFLFDGTHYIDLPALGGAGTGNFAEGLNNLGQVVGYSQVAVDGDSHATLWENGKVMDLNQYLPAYLASAGWVLNTAYGINDYGVIVGAASNSSDPNHVLTAAFEVAPVPVPGAVWLFGSALAGLIGLKRIKNGLTA